MGLNSEHPRIQGRHFRVAIFYGFSLSSDLTRDQQQLQAREADDRIVELPTNAVGVPDDR